MTQGRWQWAERVSRQHQVVRLAADVESAGAALLLPADPVQRLPWQSGQQPGDAGIGCDILPCAALQSTDAAGIHSQMMAVFLPDDQVHLPVGH